MRLMVRKCIVGNFQCGIFRLARVKMDLNLAGFFGY